MMLKRRVNQRVRALYYKGNGKKLSGVFLGRFQEAPRETRH